MIRRRPLLASLLVAAFLALLAAGASAIVGGTRADPAAWPFVVAIVRAQRRDDVAGQFCGGSLIAPRAVLTAAHCLDGRALEVLAGTTTLSAGGGETARVAERRLAPGYDPVDTEPDLAVLVLDRPLSTPVVAVAGPAEAGAPAGGALTAPGRPVAAAGWGLTRRAPRVFADDLRAAHLRVLPDWACAAAHGELWIPRTQLCAGTPTARPDTCAGDSGGPLIARTAGGAPRLVGVVSYGGEDCGLPERPGVYARTAPFARWIAREAARAQLLAAPAIQPRPLRDRERDAIDLAFGARDCPAVTRCYVDLRTRGPVERLGGGLRLSVRRLGDAPLRRTARFQRVQAGRWRAWTNLPYGEIHLRAYGVDASGALVTRTIRDALEITREQ